MNVKTKTAVFAAERKINKLILEGADYSIDDIINETIKPHIKTNVEFTLFYITEYLKYAEYIFKFENVFRESYYTDFLEIFEIDDDTNLFMFLENKIDNFVCTSIDKKEIELVLKETYNIREPRILEIYIKGFCDNISRYHKYKRTKNDIKNYYFTNY